MSVRDNYTMINIREYLALGTDEEVGEPALVRMLSDFSCPKNPDVEYFYAEIYYRKLIIFLEVLKCRQSLMFQGFPAFLVTEDVLKSP